MYSLSLSCTMQGVVFLQRNGTPQRHARMALLPPNPRREGRVQVLDEPASSQGSRIGRFLLRSGQSGMQDLPHLPRVVLPATNHTPDRSHRLNRSCPLSSRTPRARPTETCRGMFSRAAAQFWRQSLLHFDRGYPCLSRHFMIIIESHALLMTRSPMRMDP